MQASAPWMNLRNAWFWLVGRCTRDRNRLRLRRTRRRNSKLLRSLWRHNGFHVCLCGVLSIGGLFGAVRGAAVPVFDPVADDEGDEVNQWQRDHQSVEDCDVSASWKGKRLETIVLSRNTTLFNFLYSIWRNNYDANNKFSSIYKPTFIIWLS